jgi:hypothetical protein
VDLVDRKSICLAGLKRALGVRLVQRLQAQVDGKDVLDDFAVAFARVSLCLLARVTHELLINRHVDSAH